MWANLIAIEGADKCGKATQALKLAQRLRSDGFKVATFEVPYNDHVSHKLIYWFLKKGYAKTLPNLFQTLQCMNKLIFQWTVLLWAFIKNDFIILDRWKLSSLVYGNATGVNKWLGKLLYYVLKEPDATIILHGTSFKRLSTQDDVYERDFVLQNKVKQAYYEWGTTRTPHERYHCLVIDNDRPVDTITQDMKSQIILTIW